MSLARRRFALCFAICLLPAAAAADQISFTYRVDISTRCVPGVGCGAFTESFPLTLTFDSAVTFASVDSLNGMEVHYGTPKWSPIPLQRPDVADGASGLPVARHQSGRMKEPLGWRHQAGINQFAELLTEDFSYSWNLNIFGLEEFLPNQPVLTPASFGKLLGKVPASFPPDVSTFVYGILGMSHGDPFRIDPRSVAYGGNIVLLDDPSAVRNQCRCFSWPAGWAHLALEDGDNDDGPHDSEN